MKLIIQIPCFNEADTLPEVVKYLPRQIEGIDELEVLVVDDGSTDGTVEIAKKLNVDHIVSFKQRRGLAKAFMAGIITSLRLGADIIVNTDGDNQYKGEDIAGLVEPILSDRADMVIGVRQFTELAHVPYWKRLLYKVGNWVVNRLARTHVRDCTSGFRSFTKEYAAQIAVLSDFTYTLETLIQAGEYRVRIGELPIVPNSPTRPSRLFKFTHQYLFHTFITLVKVSFFYRPLRTFSYVAFFFLLVGLLFGLSSWVSRPPAVVLSVVQSLPLALILVVIGLLVLVLGFLADLAAMHRRWTECMFSKYFPLLPWEIYSTGRSRYMSESLFKEGAATELQGEEVAGRESERDEAP